jgi:hypothetical protein
MSATTLTQETRRARKVHRCSDCCTQIDPGTLYAYAVIVNEDGIYTWKSHRGCVEILHAYADQYLSSDEGVEEGWLVSCYDPGDLTRAQIDRALADVDDAERARVLALLGEAVQSSCGE